MTDIAAQWCRHFRREVSRDGSFDSICVVCCSTIARYQQYDDLERIEQDHLCYVADLSYVRKAPSARSGTSSINLPAVA